MSTKLSLTHPICRRLLRRYTALIFAVVAASLAGAFIMPQSAHAADTSWMRGKWGIALQYTPLVSSDRDYANKVINRFDVNALADQVQSVGASWVIMALGQNTSYFCSPNTTLSNLVGWNAGTDRDLISDLGAALHQRGIRLIVYFPSAPPEVMYSQTLYTLHDKPYEEGGNGRRAEFQNNWQNVIAEWSNRWSQEGVFDGWWFDGAYDYRGMYDFNEYDPNTGGPCYETFADAARAGNDNLVVAFNDGFGPTSNHTQFTDYTAGEIWKPEVTIDQFPECPAGGQPEFIDDVFQTSYTNQWHLLSFLGNQFGGQNYDADMPRFTNGDNDKVISYMQRTLGAGGSITWDVPLHLGDEHDSDQSFSHAGQISENFMPQLQAIGQALAP